MPIRVELLTYEPLKGFEDTYEINKYGVIRQIGNKHILPTHSRTNEKGDIYATQVNLRKYINGIGYTQKYTMGRVVCNHFHPNPLGLPEVDHIDHNPANNKPENLRWCTRRENNNNKKYHVTWRYIYPIGSKYRVIMFVDGTKKYFGSYSMIHLAIKARNEACKQYNIEIPENRKFKIKLRSF